MKPWVTFSKIKIHFHKLFFHDSMFINCFFDISGEMDLVYRLSYSGYAPRRLIDHFDQVTTSILENGLHNFYFSFAKFLDRIQGKEENVDSKMFKPLKLEQLYFFLTACAVQMMIAIIVFVIELMIHRIHCRQNHRNPRV